MNYKAIFFDVGNTLLYPYPSVEKVCAEVMFRYGYSVDSGELSKAFRVADDYYLQRYEEDDSFWMDEDEAASMWEDFYELLLRETGIDGDTRLIARAIYDDFGKKDRWRIYSDVVPAFERFKDFGLKLGLISNWDGRLAALCEELDLIKYLEFVISSANVGSIKPHPKIFELGLSKIGASPEHVIHVGDHHYADVMGAKGVGITPVLINRGSNLSSEDTDCLIIKDLFELIDSDLF